VPRRNPNPISKKCFKKRFRRANLFVFCALLPFASLWADELITTDTTWTTAVNPRVLTESVRVQNGAKLTISPGVVVKPQVSTITPES